MDTYHKEARTWVGRCFKYQDRDSGRIDKALKVVEFSTNNYRNGSQSYGHFIGVDIFLWPTPFGDSDSGFKTVIREESDFCIGHLVWGPIDISEAEFNVILEAAKKAEDAGTDLNKFLSGDSVKRCQQVDYMVMGRIY
jgi:hypothetical protein